MMFKVGDVVECLEDCDGQFTKGGKYTVRGVDPYTVKVVRDDSGSPNGWMNEYFRLAEPRKSPVRTITRREIVPGTYGRIKVTGAYEGTRVTMEWDRNDVITAAVPIVGLSAEELREAAHLFNQLAEVLEENK